MLVVAHHLGNCRVKFQQTGGCRSRHHIQGTVPLGQQREERGGQYHVAKKGGLYDQGGRTVRRYGGGFGPLGGPPSFTTVVPPFRRTVGH
jgi:hypothetical protein